MDVASLVWFSSRPHPFAVQARPCLDLECACRDSWLTLTEVSLQGVPLRQPLCFELRVDLSRFVQRDPPPRSPEVEALAREFLVRFPPERIEDLVTQWNQQRTLQQRLATFTSAESRDELLSFAEILHEEGGFAQGGSHYSYFFLHQDREYLLQDHYCANPDCDCREVHVEFWERSEQQRPQHRVHVRQILMATFCLTGQLREIPFSQEGSSSAQRLLQAWRRECSYQFDEFRHRYEQVKAIGQRSFPKRRVLEKKASRQSTRSSGVASQVGRNDPCPCSSGRKFKPCCARQQVSGKKS